MMFKKVYFSLHGCLICVLKDVDNNMRVFFPLSSECVLLFDRKQHTQHIKSALKRQYIKLFLGTHRVLAVCLCKTCLRTHAHARTHARARRHARTHTRTHTRTRTRAHVHTRTHARTHTHTMMSMWFNSFPS